MYAEKNIKNVETTVTAISVYKEQNDLPAAEAEY